jgi:hypothetical protein
VTRDDVRRLLLARDPADPKEHADRDAMLGFLDELPEPFSREQAHAHFTASALVVDPARTRTALVHHRKLGIWVQPGAISTPATRRTRAPRCGRCARRRGSTEHCW